jgi:hypothetical protein
MKQTYWFVAELTLTLLTLPTEAQIRAVKLWPQLTRVIYNHANVLVMRCEVADDGLTVTDAAWDSYQVAGCGKRWTLNMGAPMNLPLKDYKFSARFSGLPVNLTVEFYNPAKPWEVKKNYQEILLLGGKQSIGLPEWFHTPTNRLAYDFDEGDWFPSGWTLPRGKYALWQGAAKARQQDRKGQCPMINNSKPSQLYAFVQEWEQGKLTRPQVPNVLSTWIQVEFVDNYPLSQYRFSDANGKPRLEGIKHQVPASATYALSLFGHCLMDGLQCWDVGARYSEELRDYSDWRVREPSVKRAVNGAEVPLTYYLKYFGFYNFHVLGMWQASQNKDIIEAATAWEMPEIRSSKSKVWHVGDERFPSFASLHKEPLVRIKRSVDGKTLLVLACNPHNQGVEQVTVRRPGGTEEFGVELVGDYPLIKRFPVTPRSTGPS